MSGAPGVTYDEVKALKPCEDLFLRVTNLLGGAEHWNGEKINARAAREAGVTYDELIWVASRLASRDADIDRRMRLHAVDCAAHALHLFEREYPTDTRPRNAIVATRQCARGIKPDNDDRPWDAMTAGWAGRRACYWAAWDAAEDAEREWQFDRLIARLSEEEPEDYPLPEPPQ